MQFALKSALVGLLVASASAAPVELDARAASSKKGAAYNDGAAANVFRGTTSWGYSWGSAANGLDKSMEFVPMIHGATDDEKTIAGFVASLKGAKNMLGYNEPDQVGAGGTGSSVGTTAAAWKALLPRIPAGVKIGAPAVTSDEQHADKGLGYLSQWIKAVGGPAASKVDFQPLHWYGGEEDVLKQAELCKDYLTRAAAKLKSSAFYGRDTKIWLTEFGAGPYADYKNVPKQKAFLKAMVPWLEQQDFIARYSPFMAAEGYLVHQGAPSDSGAMFINPK